MSSSTQSSRLRAGLSGLWGGGGDTTKRFNTGKGRADEVTERPAEENAYSQPFLMSIWDKDPNRPIHLRALGSEPEDVATPLRGNQRATILDRYLGFREMSKHFEMLVAMPGQLKMTVQPRDISQCLEDVIAKLQSSDAVRWPASGTFAVRLQGSNEDLPLTNITLDDLARSTCKLLDQCQNDSVDIKGQIRPSYDRDVLPLHFSLRTLTKGEVEQHGELTMHVKSRVPAETWRSEEVASKIEDWDLIDDDGSTMLSSEQEAVQTSRNLSDRGRCRTNRREFAQDEDREPLDTAGLTKADWIPLEDMGSSSGPKPSETAKLKDSRRQSKGQRSTKAASQISADTAEKEWTGFWQ